MTVEKSWPPTRAAGSLTRERIFRNSFDVSIAYIYLSGVHATIYGRGQMVIPAQARRKARLATGDVVSVEPDGDGRIILIRLEEPKPAAAKIRVIRRKGKHAVGVSDRTVSAEEVQKFIDEFP